MPIKALIIQDPSSKNHIRSEEIPFPKDSVAPHEVMCISHHNEVLAYLSTQKETTEIPQFVFIDIKKVKQQGLNLVEKVKQFYLDKGMAAQIFILSRESDQQVVVAYEIVNQEELNHITLDGLKDLLQNS